MEISRPVVEDVRALPAPLVGSARLARLISNIISPPVIAVAAIALSAAAAQASWSWTAFHLLSTAGIPVVYVAWLVRTGQATDFDLSRREQRHGPYVLALACLALAWVVLDFGSGPALLIALTRATLAQSVFLFFVNQRWKISAHAAAIAGFVILAVKLFGPGAMALALLVPLVAWSRVRLSRHDVLQTAAGAVLGGAIFAAGLYLAG